MNGLTECIFDGTLGIWCAKITKESPGVDQCNACMSISPSNIRKM